MTSAGARGALLWRIAALLWMILMFWLSSRSDLPGGFDLPGWLPLDKVAHFGLFGVLAALLYLAGSSALLAVAIAALYGVSDEVHQMFVPGRSPDVRDWLADLAGALAGVWAVILMARGGSRRRQPLE